jgi:putative phosphoserine phosphatase/1-acylglycerol-3-phosphate O-acyltransferase
MDDIIEHHKFQDTLKDIALTQNLDLEAVKKQAAICIKELYAQQHPMAKLLSVKGFDFILSRAYNDKIDVDPRGIKKLMKLMQRHSVAFIMTHKPT